MNKLLSQLFFVFSSKKGVENENIQRQQLIEELHNTKDRNRAMDVRIAQLDLSLTGAG